MMYARFARPWPLLQPFIFTSIHPSGASQTQGTRAYGSCLTIYELLPEDAESELQEKVAAWEARQAEATPPLRREDGKMAAYFAAGGLEAGEEDDARSSGSGSSSEVGNVYGRAGGEDEKEARAAAVEGIYLPRCLCVLSKYPFVNTTRAWLMQLYRLSLSPTPGKTTMQACDETPTPLRFTVLFLNLPPSTHPTYTV